MITKRKFQVPEGIPLKAFEDMTIGEIKKFDLQYKRLLKGGKK